MRIVQIILLVALSSLTFLNSLNNGFVYDDVFTITDNYFIRDWGNFPDLFTNEYFKNSGEATYRPVVTLTYFTDYWIWGLNPAGYHLTNVLFHIIAVVLVYEFISVKNRGNISFLAGVLFALHPVLTEAVNGISYREDIFVTVFFLTSILLFIRSCRRPQTYIYLYPLSLISYLFALCSKEMAITLPFVIFLFDWLFYGKDRLKKNAVKYYVGFVLVSAFYLFLRFVWFHDPVEDKITYPGNSFLVNLCTMPKILASYVKLFFIPVRFNAEYVIPLTRTPFALECILCVLFLGTIGTIIYRVYVFSREGHDRPGAKNIFFFLLWFVITLSPVINIIPIANIMAERYLYLPSVGIFPVFAYILTGIWKHTCMWNKKKNFIFTSGGDYGGKQVLTYTGDKNIMWTIPGVIFFIFLISIPMVFCAIITIRRNTVWKDQFHFWLQTTKDSPESARAHNNLGMLYHQKGENDSALREFQMAVSIEPDPEYYHNLGMAYQHKGMREKALEIYRSVLTVSPNSAITYNNLGNILFHESRLDEAIAHFKKAIQLDPKYYEAYFNMGLAYFKKGRLDDSQEAFKHAIRLEPDHAEVHSSLGTVYANKGLFEEAIQEYEETVQLDPEYASAYKNLGIIYLNYKKDRKKSLPFFHEYLRLQPNGIEAEWVRQTIEKIKDVR